MKTTDKDIQEIFEKTGVKPAVIAQLKSSWPGCDMQKVLCALIDRELASKREMLEEATLTNLQDIQGSIKGLRTARGIINQFKE